MRIVVSAALAVALGVATGCGKDDTPATPAANPPQAAAPAPAAPATQKPPAAPAAAQITEAQVEATMKQIAQQNGVLQKSIKANMLPEAGAAAKELATAFANVERFFQQYKKQDAVKLAQQGRTGATDAAAAATAGDQMKAATAAASVGATCKQCHSVYREGDATAGYRINMTALKAP